eukprot:6145991-Prymnesium_polylepis.1
MGGCSPAEMIQEEGGKSGLGASGGLLTCRDRCSEEESGARLQLERFAHARRREGPLRARERERGRGRGRRGMGMRRVTREAAATGIFFHRGVTA